MPERAASWLRYAQDDLSVARLLLRRGYVAQALFHGQQAAEKALKAVLVAASGAAPRGHDLVQLGQLAAMPDDLFAGLSELSGAYLIMRYPDAVPTGSRGDQAADEHIAADGRVLEWAGARLQTR